MCAIWTAAVAAKESREMNRNYYVMILSHNRHGKLCVFIIYNIASLRCVLSMCVVWIGRQPMRHTYVRIIRVFSGVLAAPPLYCRCSRRRCCYRPRRNMLKLQQNVVCYVHYPCACYPRTIHSDPSHAQRSPCVYIAYFVRKNQPRSMGQCRRM